MVGRAKAAAWYISGWSRQYHQRNDLYWPSGLVQEIGPIAAGKIFTIREGKLPWKGFVELTTPTRERAASEQEFNISIFPNPNDGTFLSGLRTRVLKLNSSKS
ncbi:MAG: hypothetical protein H6555_06945 [Lewinellaceae bacterium]|nr:hypothetical protein [Lewinellaceae bacterium]